MAELAHFSALIALHIDGFAPGDEGGTVSLRPGGAPLGLSISAALQRAFVQPSQLAELTLATGADWAMTVHSQPYMLRVRDLPGLSHRLRSA